MLLLIDIGNTNTHAGLSDKAGVSQTRNLPTVGWFDNTAQILLKQFIGNKTIEGLAVCSVVPLAVPPLLSFAQAHTIAKTHELKADNLSLLGMDYPLPATLGGDRLANAVAACVHFGAPCMAVDFGTAMTIDVVSRDKKFIGGIIAPGISVMTDYLHEKTSLLPKVPFQEVVTAIGKSTEQAIQIAAFTGYRGLVRELIAQVKAELRAPDIPVVATGGYAASMAACLPEVTHTVPHLTLEGLRLEWQARYGAPS